MTPQLQVSVGDEGLIHLAPALAKMHVVVLTIHDCGLTDIAGPPLAQIIKAPRRPIVSRRPGPPRVAVARSACRAYGQRTTPDRVSRRGLCPCLRSREPPLVRLKGRERGLVMRCHVEPF